MVFIPFYYVARDVIGFLRSLQPATKLPGADAGREEKVNSPLFGTASVVVRFKHIASFVVNANYSRMRPAEKLGVANCGVRNLIAQSPNDSASQLDQRSGDPRFETIVACTIGFCLIRQSSAGPIAIPRRTRIGSV